MKRSRIALVVGPSNSGKTAYLESILRRSRLRGKFVGGLLSHGLWVNGDKSGFNLEMVASGAVHALATMEPHGANDLRCGRFYFAPAVLELAANELINCAGDRVVVVDEFGPLEAAGQGLWAGIDCLLRNHAGCLLIAVRPALLAELQQRIRAITG